MNRPPDSSHSQEIVLASSSPRRRELLAQIGVSFSHRSPQIDEAPRQGESPRSYVERMAREKAECILHGLDAGCLVIGSDTSVVLGERILGKPADFGEFRGMMRQLSGGDHQVMTAVAVAAADEIRCITNVSQVSFRPVTDAEIEAYWATGEPLDKAGGYAIQGHGAVFISHLEGSFSGVMGLPLFETAELLKGFGVDVWEQRTIE
ncbi:MAG: Maf family protein [Gammaproteobacteria bacterium]